MSPTDPTPQPKQNSSSAEAEYALLATTTKKILEEKDISKVLQTVCEEACRVLGAERSMIARVPINGTPRREILCAHNIPQDYLDRVIASRKKSLLHEAFQERRMKVYSDVENESKLFDLETVRRMGHRVISVVPLFLDENFFGALVLYHLTPREYTLHDLRLAEAFGDLAGIAIEKAQLVETLGDRIDEQKSLQRALEQVASGQDVTEIIQAVLSESGQVMGTGRCSVMLPDEETGKLRLFASKGISSDFAKRLVSLPEPFPIGQAYLLDPAKKEPTVILDATADPFFGPIQKAEGHRTLVAFPLRVSESNIGSLFFFWTSFQEIDDHRLALGKAFANQVAVVLERARLAQKSEQRAARLEVVDQIAKAVGATLEPDELFKTIVREIRRIVPCERYLIAAFDQGVRHHWYFESEIEGSHDSEANFIGTSKWVRDVYEKKRVVNVPNLREITSQRAKVLAEAGFQSILAIPILQDGRCIAHMSLASTSPAAFTVEHEKFLTSISDHLGSAIRNASLFKAAEDRSRRLEIVARISKALGSELKPEELFNIIVQQIHKYVPCERVGISQVDRKTRKLSFVHYKSNINIERRDYDQTVSDKFFQTVYREMKIRKVPDIREWNAEWYRSHAEAGLRTHLVIPIPNNDECIAHISLFSAEIGDFSKEDEELLVSIGAHLGPAIRNASLYREVEERASRLEIVGDIAKAVGSTLRPDELFRIIVQKIRLAVPCERCLISTIDLENNRYTYWHVESDVEVESRSKEIAEEDWNGEGVYDTKQALYIPDLTQGKWSEHRRLIKGGIKSILVIPIVQDDRCIAHLNVGSTRVAAYTEHDKKLLTTIADHLGPAIRNTTLYNAAEERTAQLSVLNELNRKITENLDLDEVLNSIAAAVVSLLGGDIAEFKLLDKATGEFVVCTTCGNISAPMDQRNSEFEDDILSRRSGKCEPVIVPDAQEISKWPRLEWAREVGVHSLLIYPLQLGSTVIGAITCMSRERDLFSQKHLNLLGDLASQAVIAIQNARLHEEAKKSLEFFRSVVDDNADAIILQDPDRRIIHWNAGAEKLYGYTEEEALGQSIDFIFTDDDTVRAARGNPVFQEGKTRHFEGLRIRKDGSKVPVSVTLSPIKDEAGKVVALSAVHKDLTEHKMAKGKLMLALKEVEAASRAKSEFLSTMSHELRSPLNAVIGFSELLLRDTDDEMTHQLAPKIRDSGRYLLAMIEEILDLDRIAAGKMHLTIEPASINDLVSGVVNSWHPRLPRNFSLSLELDPASGTVNCDETRISQILNNIIENAIKYSPDGGAIEVRTHAKPNEAWVSVHDEGMGISDDAKGVIFERFHQLESGYTRRAGGLGIGLALARELIKIQGGRIWVESEVGQGSTFTFLLPKILPNEVETSANANERKAQASEEPWRGRTILVVDDEEHYHEYMKMVMASAARLESAFNGEEAIEAARREQPHLILMDLRMPIMDGLDATLHIKSDFETKNIPILAVTAQAMVEDKEQALRAGADGYITKPLNLEALTREVGRILRASEKLPLSRRYGKSG